MTVSLVGQRVAFTQAIARSLRHRDQLEVLLHERNLAEQAARDEAERTREEKHEERPDALAAGADDVFRNLVDQAHFGMKPLADHLIDSLHVGGDRMGDVVRLGV